MWTLTTVHKCYQFALKVEENNKKNVDSTSKGRGKGRDSIGHKGGYGGRSTRNKSLGDSKVIEQGTQLGGRGNYNRGRGSSTGGRGRFSSFGRGSRFSIMKCYNYGKFCHPSYICPDKASSSQGEKKITYA